MYGTSRIERYLYSLPEYRMEIQRSHFIEIYSYNGLLATRKVIEFDGDTVLCRVCGDKASGFHYGVHACEGCKGFFRRSIQQKIQYRPCLKNQQCNIMRVNRNRCQYCRLKKCIAVGMSRDAVRFGRVPKKEKAKIMEQMQKVNTQSQVNLLSTILESEGDMVQKILEAHMRTCEFTKSKFRTFFESSWQNPQFVNCSAHLACPFNPNPETAEGARISEEFSECFTPAIRNVVNFAKCIPGFLVLSQEDQVTLLKAGTFEVLLVHLACLFDSQTNTMLFMNGKLFKRVSLTVTNSAGFLLDSMFDFADRMNALQLTDEEVALFSAIVIIASDRPGLRNVEQVEKVQNRITQSLQAMMAANHSEDPALFAKLLMKIPDLRTLNTLHSEKLLGLQVSPSPGKNGGIPEKVKMSPDSHMAYFQNGMMTPGMGMLGGQQPLTPAEVAHQVAVATTHQVAMETRLQNNMMLHPSFRGYHPYNAAAAMHMKQYQASMAEMGKCPYPGADKVPKCEPPNGFKQDNNVMSESSKAENSQRSYGGYGNGPQKHRNREETKDTQRLPPIRYDEEQAKNSSTSSDQGRNVPNGNSPDSRDLYGQRSQQVPSWVTSRNQSQGHHQRSEERSSSPKQRFGESGGVKRHSEREDDPKRKVAKIWDVPIGESSRDSKEGIVNGDSRHPHLDASRMYPYPAHMLPGQQFLPYPSFPREFPPRGPGMAGGNLPSHMIPRSSQSDPERQASSSSEQRSKSISDCNMGSKDSHSPGRSSSTSSPPTKRGESSLNLPVLKSVLSSPPLSSTPVWTAERILGRRHSNEDARSSTQAAAHPPSQDRSYSEDYIRNRASSSGAVSGGFEPIHSPGSSKCTSPSSSDPYTKHKKFKMKHRSSLSSRSSDRSTPVTPDDPNQFGSHTPPAKQMSSPVQSAQERGLEQNGNSSPMLSSPRPDSFHQKLYDNNNSNSEINQEVSNINKRTSPRVSSSSPKSPYDHDRLAMSTNNSTSDHSNDRTEFSETSQFGKHDRDRGYNAPGEWNLNYDRQQHKVNFHNIRDHIGESHESRLRFSDGDKVENNNGKSSGGDNDHRKELREGVNHHHHQRHEKEHPMPPHAFGQFPGAHPHTHAPGVPPAPAPHPAYLPQMPYPPGAAGMHPALLYQYNQYAAGLQLAQLQHLQMAQAAHMAHAAHAQMQAAQERFDSPLSPTRDADNNNVVERRHGVSPTKETSPRDEVQVKQEPV